MADWMDRLILKLTPSDPKPVVVIDSDGILEFVEFQKKLRDLGYSLLPSAPGLAFRFLFELRGRKSTGVMFVLRTEAEIMPDIQLDATVVKVNLQEVFPNFDRKVLIGLTYNALCSLEAYRLYTVLSYENTIRFLLENLYQVDLTSFTSNKTKERVLALIISVVLHRDGPNKPVLEYLRQLAIPYFGKASAGLLEQKGLLNYLQDSWEQSDKDINFADPVLERKIQPLFLTKALKPRLVDKQVYDSLPSSSQLGFVYDRTESATALIKSKLAFLEERLLKIQNQHTDFFELAPHLGEVGKLVYELSDPTLTDRYQSMVRSLSQRFQIYVRDCYWNTHSLSGIQYPNSIHKVQDFVKAQDSLRKAFVVLDGMNLWQWWILRERLVSAGLEISDFATFSWLPSITAWSRQSLFKGSKPDLSEDNSKESDYFIDYWQRAGLQKYQISYSKFSVTNLPQDIAADVKVAAFICNDLDELMHSSIMGNSQLYADTVQWVATSKIVDMVVSLKNSGFLVCITTDHGNIETKPRGSISLGNRQISRSRSKRHIQFVSNDDASKFRSTVPELGIRDNSVYLTDETSFTSGELVVTHGGSHILEMLIPVGLVR